MIEPPSPNGDDGSAEERLARPRGADGRLVRGDPGGPGTPRASAATMLPAAGTDAFATDSGFNLKLHLQRASARTSSTQAVVAVYATFDTDGGDHSFSPADPQSHTWPQRSAKAFIVRRKTALAGSNLGTTDIQAKVLN